MTEVDIVLPRKNFNLEFHEKFTGDITGIFGPSGSGKTTLLQAIAGLIQPVKGTIKIGHRLLFDHNKKINLPVEKRNIGFVFQEGRLFPHMNVEQNLQYGKKKKGKATLSFHEVVNLLQLNHLLKSKPGQISGGERQRTALGRSLLSSPDILLLDEPFSALDIRLRNQIIPFILNIQKIANIPILVVSHDMPDLLKLTNSLCILKDGKCLGNGGYYDLIKHRPISEIMGSSGLVNSVNMVVSHSGQSQNLTILTWKNTENVVNIKCETGQALYTNGQQVKIFIQADDIALATEKLTNITIQNQLEGTVTDIIERGSSLLCIVNVGFKLVVKITAESQKRMHIQMNTKVWCLFKSVAIEVAGLP